MAKKQAKKESGPGPIMIVVLIFFIIATLALGFTTYTFSNDATQAQANEKTANDEKTKVQKNMTELRMRMLVNRSAMGTLTDEERKDLSAAPTETQAAILEEEKDIIGRLSNLPGRPQFAFNADHTPTKPLPLQTNDSNVLVRQLEDQVRDARAKQAIAEANEVKERNNATAAKTAFDMQVDALKAKNAADLVANQKAFDALKVTADQAAAKYKKDMDDIFEQKKTVEEQLAAANRIIKETEEKYQRALNPSNSDLEARYKRLDLAKLADRMGIITDKTDKFVTLRFETKLNLLPGQSFVVVAPNTSLAEVIDREVALDKKHYEFKSLDSREPFSDNEMIKGTLEVTEVLDVYTARARITHQVQTIRNPVAKNDQIFNVSLSTISREHVAFAGIIDLDGDGLPNTEEFIRILEKNNVVVDAYLDLKKAQVVKRGDGMTLRTKFLVVGTDAPQVGEIKKMMDEAKAKGIQMIDARKFLWLIGVRPPQNAQRPYYPGVNIVGDKVEAPKEPVKN